MDIILDNFDLFQIDKSGQCFRWKLVEKTDLSVTYLIPAFGRLLEVSQSSNKIHFDCSFNDWDLYWKSYFDIDRDYSLIGHKIKSGNDEHLKKAYDFGSGIRILKQDLWEIIFSFMVSQNNNIPRIRKSIELISKKYGKRLSDSLYAFPTCFEIPLSAFDDTSFGFGYRAEYLRELCDFVSKNPCFLDSLRDLSYEEAMEHLIKRKGIGLKVANCICLFGLGLVNSFPIDTHVKKLLEKNYPKGIDLSSYEGEKGIIQQYLFYYDLYN